MWRVVGMAILSAGGATIAIALRDRAARRTSQGVAAGALIAGFGAVGIGVAVAMHSNPQSSWIQLGFGMIFIAGILVQARARSIQT